MHTVKERREREREKGEDHFLLDLVGLEVLGEQVRDVLEHGRTGVDGACANKTVREGKRWGGGGGSKRTTTKKKGTHARTCERVGPRDARGSRFQVAAHALVHLIQTRQRPRDATLLHGTPRALGDQLLVLCEKKTKKTSMRV